MEKQTKTWLALIVKLDGGYYAYAHPVNGSDNLVAKLARISGLMSANICPSKRAASELVDHWNDCYKTNGTYAFAGGPF